MIEFAKLWIKIIAITIAVCACVETVGIHYAQAGDDVQARVQKISGAIGALAKGCPRNPANADRHYRAELATSIESAARRHRLPDLLIVAIVFRESSFHTGAVGGIGERGLMQVHGVASRGCDLTTTDGQINCGIQWLARCREQCTTVPGALIAYATGRCQTDSEHVKRLIASRIRLWKKLEKEFGQ